MLVLLCVHAGELLGLCMLVPAHAGKLRTTTTLRKGHARGLQAAWLAGPCVLAMKGMQACSHALHRCPSAYLACVLPHPCRGNLATTRLISNKSADMAVCACRCAAGRPAR